jgi:broad specificity phosphatase PhoE
VHNPDQVLYGRLPGFGLSDRGRAMAARVAETIAAVPSCPARVGVLVSSPLQRARETVAPLEAALGVHASIDERFIEGANDFEGDHIDAAYLLRPANLRRLTNPVRPSWGEPHAEIADRMWAGIADAAGLAAAAGRAVLVVSHQLPIWAARRSAEHRHIWGARQCALASLTTFTLDLSGALDPAAATDPAAVGALGGRAVRALVRGIDYSRPAAGL